MRTRLLLVVLALVIVTVGVASLLWLRGGAGEDGASAEAATPSSSMTGPVVGADTTTEPRTTVATVPMTPSLEAFCAAVVDYQRLASGDDPTTLEDLRGLAARAVVAVTAMRDDGPAELTEDLATFHAHALEYRRAVDEAPTLAVATSAGKATVTDEDSAAATRVGEWGAAQCVRR